MVEKINRLVLVVCDELKLAFTARLRYTDLGLVALLHTWLGELTPFVLGRTDVNQRWSFVSTWGTWQVRVFIQVARGTRCRLQDGS